MRWSTSRRLFTGAGGVGSSGIGAATACSRPRQAASIRRCYGRNAKRGVAGGPAVHRVPIRKRAGKAIFLRSRGSRTNCECEAAAVAKPLAPSGARTSCLFPTSRASSIRHDHDWECSPAPDWDEQLDINLKGVRSLMSKPPCPANRASAGRDHQKQRVPDGGIAGGATRRSALTVVRRALSSAATRPWPVDHGRSGDSRHLHLAWS